MGQMFISAQKSTEAEKTSHWLDIIKPKAFLFPLCVPFLHKPVSNWNISGINTENQSGRREQSYLAGYHSPFLVSSWQVTAITWAKVMTRQTVILERNEGPMSACQTCSVLTHSRETDEEVRESPTPSYSIQTEKSKYPWVEQAPGWAIMANWNKLPLYPPPSPPSFFHSPPPLLLSHHFFLLHFKASLLLGLLQLPWKM